jgi:2-polyprenyl-3-methyl-5-hydroxy-6-metoxy-1,4-benzoquinol methylase
MADAKNCRLCGSSKVTKAYEGPIRAGGADSGTVDGYRVLRCAECGVEFLDPFPTDTEAYYQGEQYWVDHHGPVNMTQLQTKHGPEQKRWFAKVGGDNLRGKRLGDFGCGAGIFLDIAKSVAAETVGVDLAEHFKAHVEASGHRFAHRAQELELNSLDVAVSFDTLEHVPNSKAFLKDIYGVLDQDGQLFIGVPNQRDFLKKFVPEYLPFFYHLSHLYYFNQEALVYALTQTGFRDIQVDYVHKYDLMNMIMWARDRKGIGTKGSEVFDSETEEDFCADLERQGIASHVLMRAVK